MNMTNPLGLSPRVLALAEQAEEERAPQFAQIDAVAEYNSQKVLAAFQKHRVAEPFFAGTTGYGYDDQGRDALDAIYADIFGAEDALVRIQFVNGTHAIASALYGVLRPGDVLVSAVGAPYDTLLGVIGVTGDEPGSLKQYGVAYRQVDITQDNQPDRAGLAEVVRDPKVKAVLIPVSYTHLQCRGTMFCSFVQEDLLRAKEWQPASSSYHGSWSAVQGETYFLLLRKGNTLVYLSLSLIHISLTSTRCRRFPF